MTVYEKSLMVLAELFGKDCQFALATSKDNIPSVRFVDTFYESGSFYVVTYANSQKAVEICTNAKVALCNKLYKFSGTAYSVGHPLNNENSQIRGKLVKVFEPWYFEHNNEDDANMCYIKIDLDYGFFYKDGIGYQANFNKKTAEEFPFEFDIMITE